jgi:hypothetical protein
VLKHLSKKCQITVFELILSMKASTFYLPYRINIIRFLYMVKEHGHEHAAWKCSGNITWTCIMDIHHGHASWHAA